MLVDSMRVSRDTDRPPTDRPRAALRAAGVDPRPLWTAPTAHSRLSCRVS